MESERYKEYHFFWGIFSKLCKFLSFTYLSEPHIAYMHRHLKDLPWFSVKLSKRWNFLLYLRCQVYRYQEY